MYVHVHTDVVALTGCARASLGICASSSGAVAGLLHWQVLCMYLTFEPSHPQYIYIYMYLITWSPPQLQDEGGTPIDCSTGTSGKRVCVHVYTYPRTQNFMGSSPPEAAHFSLKLCICIAGSCGLNTSCTYLTCAHTQIPGIIDGVKFQSLGARYILVVEKDAVFTYLCGQRIWDTLPCIIVTGCGYPPLSVRATVKTLAHQFSLPVVGLFDYNPHGVRILLTYKFGSARMGLESHSYAVDNIQWVGVHYRDLFDEDKKCQVDETALQSWTVSDERVFSGIQTQVMAMDNPHYTREVQLMRECRVKAEIESLNSGGLDSLEQTIIRKILRKMYF